MEKQNILNVVPRRTEIIGVPISVVNMEDCLQFVSQNFEAIRGEYICASNVHTTVMAHEDSRYMKVQSESILSIPDGKPLSVVGRKNGYLEMDKVTGTHFMQNTFTDSRFQGRRHYFYGTSDKTLNQMIMKVKQDYPNLCICGYEPSVFRELAEIELEELARRINQSEADFVWVALGAPRQELLMNRLKGKVNSLMIGVGGAFNILAGIVKDAPMWMQNAGLEWLYRLCNEPKRLFKRYFVTNSKFIYYLVTTKGQDSNETKSINGT